MYTFYTKATADGGSFVYFGPYTLNIGCPESLMSITDNSAFVSSVALSVGDAVNGIYQFSDPIPEKVYSYC